MGKIFGKANLNNPNFLFILFVIRYFSLKRTSPNTTGKHQDSRAIIFILYRIHIVSYIFCPNSEKSCTKFSDEDPCVDETLSNKPIESIFFLIFDSTESSSKGEKSCILLDQVKLPSEYRTPEYRINLNTGKYGCPGFKW